MPIDIANETIFPLCEAPNQGRVPCRRRGRKPAVSTFFRWAAKGVRGVRLEVVQVGGTKCTSVSALQRFFDRLTALESPCDRPDESTARARQADRAEEELAARWRGNGRGRPAVNSLGNGTPCRPSHTSSGCGGR
jgi:hypothetical protein